MLDRETMVLNILGAYADATPSERTDGFSWYDDAKQFASNLSSAYGITLEQAAGVIAVLSPQMDWEANKRWAAELCFAWRADLPLPRRGLTNSLRRAMIILNGDLSDVERSKGTMKVNRFYLSILGRAGYATIDRHAIRVALGDFINNVPAVSDKQYEVIERAYVEAARELKKATRHVQAVTWIVCRRERGL